MPETDSTPRFALGDHVRVREGRAHEYPSCVRGLALEIVVIDELACSAHLLLPVVLAWHAFDRHSRVQRVALADLEPAPAPEVEEWYEVDLLRRSSAPGATPFWHRHANYYKRDEAERDIREEHAGRRARLVRTTREVVAEFPALTPDPGEDR